MSLNLIVEAGGVVVNIHPPCCEPAPAEPPTPNANANALQALAEPEHVSNLGLPDDSVVTLQVGFLRPRLLAIRQALEE